MSHMLVQLRLIGWSLPTQMELVSLEDLGVLVLCFTHAFPLCGSCMYMQSQAFASMKSKFTGRKRVPEDYFTCIEMVLNQFFSTSTTDTGSYVLCINPGQQPLPKVKGKHGKSLI